jgi:ABC-type dipeptide/oligopeptide/nickel transport system permease component
MFQRGSFSERLGRALAAAAIAALMCLALVAVEHPEKSWMVHTLPVLSTILDRLAPSIELLLFSCAIALAAGLVLTSLAAMNRSVSIVVTAVAAIIRNVPFFWLAIVVASPASMRGDHFFGWTSKQHFELGDHVTHAIIPGCLVAIVGLAIILEVQAAFETQARSTLKAAL